MRLIRSLEYYEKLERKISNHLTDLFPKGGPFQVTLLTTSNEHFTLTTGGGVGIIFCEGGQVFLPEFSEFMKPFIIRRANEANMDKSIQ
jgi:hypothetical protein